MSDSDHPPGAPTRYDDLRRPSHWRDRIGGPTFGGFFAVVAVFAIGWNLVENLWLPSAGWVPANLLLAVLLVASARRVGLDFEELGLRGDRVLRGLVVGGTVLLAAVFVFAVAVAVPATRDLFESARIERAGAWARAFYVVIRIPLGTVVLEEVLFRGVLLALALRRWSVLTAVLVVSGLFGLWHIVPAAEGAGNAAGSVIGAILGTVAVTGAAGTFFAWLRLRANSIVAPMLAHVATNSLAYLAVVVALQLRSM